VSETYNPETLQFEELESLKLEAQIIAQQWRNARTEEARDILHHQLAEVERRIEKLKLRLKKAHGKTTAHGHTP
jgi:hypothetical protein